MKSVPTEVTVADPFPDPFVVTVSPTWKGPFVIVPTKPNLVLETTVTV